jgi:hypothetical protein
MSGRSAEKRAKKEDAAEAGRLPREKSQKDADPMIPVCLGEFGIDEAENFRPLWEATWSQDARSRTKKK